jgi:RNA polymerase sigma-70 factor (ECF subfamily)
MNDDLAVIQRVITGDVESFRVLVQRYQHLLFATVRNLVPDAGECEDVAQEVFLAAFTHLGSYDPRRAAFSTWLLTIARNKCWNMLSKKRPQLRGRLPEGADRRTPDREAAEAECFRRLDEALAALPFEQKTAFVLAEIQGLSLEEVAKVEGVKVGTVKSRLSRAREKLRAWFRPAVEQP